MNIVAALLIFTVIVVIHEFGHFLLAKKNGIDRSDDELFLEANKWELSHGGLSGRTAQQFIDYLAGTR